MLIGENLQEELCVNYEKNWGRLTSVVATVAPQQQRNTDAVRHVGYLVIPVTKHAAQIIALIISSEYHRSMKSKVKKIAKTITKSKVAVEAREDKYGRRK